MLCLCWLVSFVKLIIYLIYGTVKGENEEISLFLGMNFIPNNRCENIPNNRSFWACKSVLCVVESKKKG